MELLDLQQHRTTVYITSGSGFIVPDTKNIQTLFFCGCVELHVTEPSIGFRSSYILTSSLPQISPATEASASADQQR